MIRFVLALLLMVAPFRAHADNPPSTEVAAPSLEWMLGNWSGSGKLFGQDSRVTLSVRPVAGEAAYSFDYQVMTAAGQNRAETRFQAHAFFQRGKGNQWHGRWVDNFGNLHDISASLDRNNMTSTWGSPSTEIGRSTYILNDGRMLVTDWALGRDGVFKQFAQSELVRE
jgi:hypothetical protein